MNTNMELEFTKTLNEYKDYIFNIFFIIGNRGDIRLYGNDVLLEFFHWNGKFNYDECVDTIIKTGTKNGLIFTSISANYIYFINISKLTGISSLEVYTITQDSPPAIPKFNVYIHDRLQFRIDPDKVANLNDTIDHNLYLKICKKVLKGLKEYKEKCFEEFEKYKQNFENELTTINSLKETILSKIDDDGDRLYLEI